MKATLRFAACVRQDGFSQIVYVCDKTSLDLVSSDLPCTDPIMASLLMRTCRCSCLP
jgi:hypothetical protein